MIHLLFHYVIVVIGFFVNATTSAIIIKKTPSNLKEYSLLLLNTSFTDLISVLAHYALDGRIFVSGSAMVVLSNGPCRAVSDTLCAGVNGFLNLNMIHSGTIVAVSFWYRLRVVRGKDAFGRWRLQAVCLLLFVPHVAQLASALATASPRASLATIVNLNYHSSYADGYTLFGYVDMSELLPSIISSYLVVFPIISYIYVFWARKKLMSMLDAKKEHMSERSRSSHKSLAKALTIHAIFPIFNMTCMAILCTAQINFGLHSKEIEGLAFDLAAVPVLVNPLLTLYFVRPYQVFIRHLVGNERSDSTVVISIGSSTSHDREFSN